MTKPELKEINRLASEIELSLWIPNPDQGDDTKNPQRLALESKADVLGFGGQAGGGKSSLLLGCALTRHQRAVIFRRVFPNLKGIIEDAIELIGTDDHYNKTEKTWRLGGKILEFASVQYEDDKKNWRGRPHDFYGFDEATEFTRSQFEYIIAWLRSTDSKQRCRVILTFNPPEDEAGSWVVDYFLPWISYLFPDNFTHPNPAKPGELRWYATIDGKETECKNGEEFKHNRETIQPMSRTFIPSRLIDNPHLAETGYARILQALPEPLRSQVLYGDFAAARKANPWQVLPTEWVRMAQQRWLEMEKPNVQLSGVGVDVARGGQDKLTISKRYANWFAEVVSHPGVDVTNGPQAAELVRQSIEPEIPGYINIDIIGVGTSAYDSLEPMYSNVNGINASSGSSYTDRSGRLKMRNMRAEYYWCMREALDPEHGDNIGLPPGNEIVADLCVATYKNTTAGIQIEEKEKIIARIGRSPDVGEAIILANLDDQGEVEIIGMGQAMQEMLQHDRQ